MHCKSTTERERFVLIIQLFFFSFLVHDRYNMCTCYFSPLGKPNGTTMKGVLSYGRTPE